MKGRKYRDFDRWHGPGVVIGDERNPDAGRKGYSALHNGQLLLVAPEHIRLATRLEQMTPGLAAQLLKESPEELNVNGGLDEYEDLLRQGGPVVEQERTLTSKSRLTFLCRLLKSPKQDLPRHQRRRDRPIVAMLRVPSLHRQF